MNIPKPDSAVNFSIASLITTQPKFLSKKEREALKKKEEEEKEQQEIAKRIEVMKHRKEILENGADERRQEKKKYSKHQGDNHHRSKRRHSSSRSRSRSRTNSKSRSRSKSNDRNRKKDSKTDKEKDSVVKVDQKELDQLKAQYLSSNKEQKKLVKPSERLKNTFNFEWDASEDTSVEVNPLYANRHQPTLLFGKGKIGGLDVEEQKRKYEEQKEKSGHHTEDGDDKEKKGGKYNELGDITHWSQKTVEQMTDRDWRIFREDHEIYIKGGRVPPPIRNWKEAHFPDFLSNVIKTMKYKDPTPIQMQALTCGNERKDLIGLAPTGSGKTAAYLIPFILYINSLPPISPVNQDDGPYGLIICPTRELSIQVHQEFLKFSAGTKLRAAAVVGGKSVEDQAFEIMTGVEVIIGTPGRIEDAIKSRYTVLNQCSYVVIDEADKMVEMDLEETLSNILDAIPKSNMKSTDETTAELQEKKAKSGQAVYRVTHMFSATMPNQVERIARKYLRSPAYISIGDPGAGKKDIEQRVEIVSEGEKKRRLKNILDNAEPPIIIFLNEKKAVEYIAGTLEKWGWKAVIYHGGKTQEQREKAVEQFKARKYDILVCTDLAGRGLDVEGVKFVINFDAPKSLSDFVHRTGRTGRAGKKGIAYTFLTLKNEDLFYEIKNFLVQNGQHVPAELADHPASRVKPGTIENVPRRKQVIFAA